MLLSYYVAQDWDVIPLHSEGTPRYVKDKHTHQWIQKGAHSGKEPRGRKWQKKYWGLDLMEDLKYENFGLRHCNPVSDKLPTIGIDFDGSLFMTYEHILNLLRQCTEPWVKGFLGVYTKSALMQSSPTHKHLLFSLNRKIRKIKIFHHFEELEILGLGEQSAIPPSICSKPGGYTRFQRYWIEDRKTIEPISWEVLAQFLKWLAEMDRPKNESKSLFTWLANPMVEIKEGTIIKHTKKRILLRRKPKLTTASQYIDNIIELTPEEQKIVAEELLKYRIIHDKDIPGSQHSYHVEFQDPLLYLKGQGLTRGSIEGILHLVVPRLTPTPNDVDNLLQYIDDMFVGDYNPFGAVGRVNRLFRHTGETPL